VGAQLQEVGNKEKATSAGGSQPAFEQGRDVMFDAVTGNNHLPCFTGAVENLDLFFGQEAWGKRP